MLQPREGAVDEAFVLGREVERHGDEDQRKKHVLRGWDLVEEEVEEVEEERARGEEPQRRNCQDRPGTGPGPVALLLVVLVVVFVLFLVFDEDEVFLVDGGEAVNGGSDGG